MLFCTKISGYNMPLPSADQACSACIKIIKKVIETKLGILGVFATPKTTRVKVAQGSKYKLFEQAENKWKNWQAKILIK